MRPVPRSQIHRLKNGQIVGAAKEDGGGGLPQAAALPLHEIGTDYGLVEV